MAEYTTQALRDEIDNDPQGIGYKNGTTWKADSEIRDLINDPANGINMRKNRMTAKEFVESIDVSEWDALTVGERQYCSMLIRDGFVDVEPDRVFTNLNGVIFTNARCPNSRALLIGVLTFAGSRAENLWGEGFTVNTTMVGEARDLP